MAIKNQLKNKLHPKNIHRNGYNFKVLIRVYPALKEFVFFNKFGTETIDFSNAKAVKAINTALLFAYYKLSFWNFPESNLCPAIPGRADYMHHLNDLLKSSGLNNNIKILDIGTGASCIYPLLGNAIYDWKFVGTDTDKNSLKSADKILQKNKLSQFIELKQQLDSNRIFKGIINKSDKYTATTCNPPFYKSEEEAMLANERKRKGLKIIDKTSLRNFSGKEQELWYKGGEKAFVHTYLYESSMFKKQCFWFTTLVSKKENLKGIYSSLEKLGAKEIKTIPMQQGNKITRIVTWTFLNKKEQKEWNTSYK